jgi:general secretion pathway protein I
MKSASIGSPEVSRLSHAPRSERHRADAGFTLVEVLVALGVLATALGAIGSLIATTVRGMQAIDNHLMLVETARAIETGLPNRGQLGIGNISGEFAGHRWRVDVLPFIAPNVDQRQPTPWVPQRVVTRVQSPAGPIVQIDTVRLRRREGGG